MRKIILGLSIMTISLGLFGCTNAENGENGFDTSKNITTYTRDTESGTRDGFFTAIGFKDAVKSDAVLLSKPAIVSGNGDMIKKVSNDEYGLGYISYASYLEVDSLLALNYEGVTPSEEAIVDGTYKLSRNFNYITRTKEDMTDAEYNALYAFVKYSESKEGLALVKANSGILTKDINSAKSFAEIKESDEIVKNALANTEKVTLKVGGSTSVEGIAKALTSAFSEVTGGKVEFIANHTGSGDAYKNTQGEGKDSQNKLHIGYLSRELNDSEPAAENTSGLICKDGIVAVVNNKNTAVTNVTAKELVDIYKGDIKTWNELKA